MKLSVASVEQMKLYTDTQKCEAVKRTLSVSLLKNDNFSATMEGWCSSAIHRVNNDPGTSTIKKGENSRIDLSSRTKHSLTAADMDADNHRNYAKRSEHNFKLVVKHKLVVHSNKTQAHSDYKQINNFKSDYRKGHQDPFPSNCAN